MKLTSITAAIAAVVSLSPVTYAAHAAEPGVSKRQDDPYNINWSFLSAKEGDPFIQRGIHADGVWHSIPGEQQVFAGALREGGADGDLARCFFDDLNHEVFHQQFASFLNYYPDSPSGLIGYQICCFYEMKDNGLEPDPPRCCHDPECDFMANKD